MMFFYENNWALVVPMANEGPDFAPLLLAVTGVLDRLKCGTVYFSTAHFCQTELRYPLRNRRIMEVPIHYRAPSPRVSQKAIANSLKVLATYVFNRLTFSAPEV